MLSVQPEPLESGEIIEFVDRHLAAVFDGEVPPGAETEPGLFVRERPHPLRYPAQLLRVRIGPELVAGDQHGLRGCGAHGRMFWLRRNKLSGSQRCFTATRRS